MRTCWLAFPKPVALTCDWKTRMSGVLKVHIESGCGNSLEARHQDIHADSTRSHRVMDLDVETEVLPVFCKERVVLVRRTDGKTELSPEYTRGR